MCCWIGFARHISSARTFYKYPCDNDLVNRAIHEQNI